MTKVDDLHVIEDFLPFFNTTLNDDAKIELKKILSTPLNSPSSINDRQQILKAIILSELPSVYGYHKTDYAEVSYFLNVFDSKDLKNVDYLTYIFQKRHNNRLVGHYIQLSYFLLSLDKIFSTHLQVENFPESYGGDLNFILNYINSFQLKKYKKQTDRGKLKYSVIQFLNKIVMEKRKNGDTIKFYSILNRFEAYIAIASAIKSNNFVFPCIVKDEFEIRQMFHPLLKHPIKNDLQLFSHVVLLTRANMSGKSTLLKTISLVVYFAHLGFAVPAENANIPFYDFISIHINHSDDIKNGLSHFMQEIVNMKRVLEGVQDGKRCFVVFDELFKGTNHQDALKISSLTIDGLRQFTTSKFLISTHIYELKSQFEGVDGLSAIHLECNIENDYPGFTYRIKEGWTNLRIGELLFEKEGLKGLLKR